MQAEVGGAHGFSICLVMPWLTQASCLKMGRFFSVTLWFPCLWPHAGMFTRPGSALPRSKGLGYSLVFNPSRSYLKILLFLCLPFPIGFAVPPPVGRYVQGTGGALTLVSSHERSRPFVPCFSPELYCCVFLCFSNLTPHYSPPCRCVQDTGDASLLSEALKCLVDTQSCSCYFPPVFLFGFSSLHLS